MCDQVPTPGRRHVADGWSMVRSQRWLIGCTFHHQKSYVVPTLGQPYQPNGWVAHVGPTWGQRWHANCDVRPTMPTMYQRWINVLLLTGKILDMFRKVSMFLYINVLINRNDAKRSNFNELITLSYYFDNSILPYSGLFSRV